jgi:dienelactone hydrolase
MLQLIALLIAFTVASRVHPPKRGAKLLTFQSVTYSSFRQVLTLAPPTARVNIQGALGFPAGARDRLPAVVLVHTGAGYRDQNEGWQAAELQRAGFATLTYDSFSARGTGNLVTTPMRVPPPYPSAIADAFAALGALARDPRVDPRRIAIVGFSFGGEVAHNTAFQRLRSALGDRDLQFAAHVAYYPAGAYGVTAGACFAVATRWRAHKQADHRRERRYPKDQACNACQQHWPPDNDLSC